MKIAPSIAVLPPLPKAASLQAGQAFQTQTNHGDDQPVYMVVTPWPALKANLREGSMQYVNLATGELHQFGPFGANNTMVCVLHAEVLVA